MFWEKAGVQEPGEDGSDLAGPLGGEPGPEVVDVGLWALDGLGVPDWH